MGTVNEVDEILLSIGTFGLYQRFQFLLIVVDIIPWAFNTMGFVFIGKCYPNLNAVATLLYNYLHVSNIFPFL